MNFLKQQDTFILKTKLLWKVQTLVPLHHGRMDVIYITVKDVSAHLNHLRI